MEGGTQNSRALSQRPDMMMTVALATSGAQLVNRSSVNVVEWEMNKAMEKKLGDGRTSRMNQQKVDFRPIKAGILLGSTHYVTGAITELNWNISSNVAEGGAFSVAVGRRTYRISIAVDVVVTNTQTTEIVHARSYKKQLVGFETNANYFRFMNHDSATKLFASGNAAAVTAVSALELFQANLGEKQSEPTQTALRWVIELAAYDIMRNLTGGGQSCDPLLLPNVEAETLVERIIAQRNAPSAPPKGAIRVAEVSKADDAPQEPVQTADDGVPAEIVASNGPSKATRTRTEVTGQEPTKIAEAGEESFENGIGEFLSSLFASPDTPPPAPAKVHVVVERTPQAAEAQKERVETTIGLFVSDLFDISETPSAWPTDSIGQVTHVQVEQQEATPVAVRKRSVAPAVADKAQSKWSFSSSTVVSPKAKLNGSSRKASKAYTQRKPTPPQTFRSTNIRMKKRALPDTFDAADLEALISREREQSSAVKKAQAAPEMTQASISGVLSSSAIAQADRGWLPGTVPTPNQGLSPNVWNGGLQ
jgi:curli production assembly/transport component CsgG/holdfast attachment protein HfaB